MYDKFKRKALFILNFLNLWAKCENFDSYIIFWDITLVNDCAFIYFTTYEYFRF